MVTIVVESYILYLFVITYFNEGFECCYAKHRFPLFTNILILRLLWWLASWPFCPSLKDECMCPWVKNPPLMRFHLIKWPMWSFQITKSAAGPHALVFLMDSLQSEVLFIDRIDNAIISNVITNTSTHANIYLPLWGAINNFRYCSCCAQMEQCTVMCM